MSNTNRSPHFISGIIAAVISVLILVAATWLFLNRQYVADVTATWTYEPSQDIEAISNRIGFTEKGKFAFYASRPEVAPAETFNQDCPRQEPNSPILGCYTSGRVFIYDITNEKLDGIEEVTAAHEMLHAVWERHSDKEKQRLSALLTDVYERGASPELHERIAYYERSEPDQVINELHSILPTEVENIGGELEEYYRQYFKDRKAVVELHQQYNGVFKQLVNHANALYAELERLSAEINAETTRYDQEVAELSRDIESFNGRAARGDFSSYDQFNAERQALMDRSAALEARRVTLGQKIDTYNSKYDEYQKIGKELETLNESIDSIKGLQEAPAL